MEQKRKRPPYDEFKAWMILNKVSRKDLMELLDISSSTLTHRLNGTGPDFMLEEIRTIVAKYGTEVAKFFYDLG